MPVPAPPRNSPGRLPCSRPHRNTRFVSPAPQVTEGFPSEPSASPPPPCLERMIQLDVDPPGTDPSVRENTPSADLPDGLKPSVLGFSPDGQLLSVGMEDGGSYSTPRHAHSLCSLLLAWDGYMRACRRHRRR